MSNPMQTKLEQIYKEYIAFRDYMDNNKKSIEEIRKEVAAKITDMEDDRYLDIMFTDFGEKQLETIDMNQHATRFYYFYQAYKELIEIPDNIKEDAEKIDVRFLYTIKNGKREIADKKLYEDLKRQFIEANREAQKN